MRILSVWYDRLIHACAAVAALLLGGIALWVTYDVIARYVLRRPTSWALDLSEYAMLWSVFLAAPWVLRQDAHIKVDLFVQGLSPQARRWFEGGTAIIGILGCAILTWEGVQTCWDLYVRGIDFAREWKVYQAAVYAVIPVGTALLTIEFALRAVRIFSVGDGAAKPRADQL